MPGIHSQPLSAAASAVNAAPGMAAWATKGARSGAIAASMAVTWSSRFSSLTAKDSNVNWQKVMWLQF